MYQIIQTHINRVLATWLGLEYRTVSLEALQRPSSICLPSKNNSARHYDSATTWCLAKAVLGQGGTSIRALPRLHLL